MQADSIEEAWQGLTKKAVPLDPEQYGEVQYTLAYAATNRTIQFFTVDVQGKVSISLAI